MGVYALIYRHTIKITQKSKFLEVITLSMGIHSYSLINAFKRDILATGIKLNKKNVY